MALKYNLRAKKPSTQLDQSEEYNKNKWYLIPLLNFSW